MPKIDPDTLKLARYLDAQVHGAVPMASIPDDEERRQAVSAFIKGRLQQASSFKESRLQRRLRKSALQECLHSIKVRKAECCCRRSVVPGVTNKVCVACVRAQEALRLWIDMEKLINARFDTQRAYFAAICNAKGPLLERAAQPAPLPELEPATVVQALEVDRAMHAEQNADIKSKKLA